MAGGLGQSIRIASAYVELGVRGDKRMKALLTRAQASIAKVAKQMRTAGLIAAAGGSAMILAFVGTAAAASDLNEAINKTVEVFGSASSQIYKFAETSADAWGISESAANSYAAELGLILQRSGETEQASAALSIQLTKLVADLASFHNVSIDVAFDKVKSGLVGESKPLRTFGILLSETLVNAKALELGFEKLGGEMTEGGKVAARRILIMEQGAKATGDFARTADRLANVTRRFQATAQDLSAEIGTRLTPHFETWLTVTQSVLNLVNKLSKAFGGLIAPVFYLTAAITAAGVAMVVTSYALDGFSWALGRWEVITKTSTRAQVILNGVLGLTHKNFLAAATSAKLYGAALLGLSGYAGYNLGGFLVGSKESSATLADEKKREIELIEKAAKSNAKLEASSVSLEEKQKRLGAATIALAKAEREREAIVERARYGRTLGGRRQDQQRLDELEKEIGKARGAVEGYGGAPSDATAAARAQAAEEMATRAKEVTDEIRDQIAALNQRARVLKAQGEDTTRELEKAKELANLQKSIGSRPDQAERRLKLLENLQEIDDARYETRKRHEKEIADLAIRKANAIVAKEVARVKAIDDAIQVANDAYEVRLLAFQKTAEAAARLADQQQKMTQSQLDENAKIREKNRLLDEAIAKEERIQQAMEERARAYKEQAKALNFRIIRAEQGAEAEARARDKEAGFTKRQRDNLAALRAKADAAEKKNQFTRDMAGGKDQIQTGAKGSYFGGLAAQRFGGAAASPETKAIRDENKKWMRMFARYNEYQKRVTQEGVALTKIQIEQNRKIFFGIENL